MRQNGNGQGNSLNGLNQGLDVDPVERADQAAVVQHPDRVLGEGGRQLLILSELGVGVAP